MQSAATPAAQHLRVPTRLGVLRVRIVGEGPATVLFPSMFVDGTTWDRLVPLLSGRRLIIVDGPGLGGSSPLERRASIAEAAEAAAELLAGLRGAGWMPEGPVDWVGNAFGGHVGYELAVRPGVLRTLVAISAPVEAVPPALRRRIRVLHPILRLLGPVGIVRDAVVSTMLTDAAAADPAVRETVVQSLIRPTRRSLSLALSSFILRREDVTAHLDSIGIPCLFVAGDDRGDWRPEDARRAAERAPRAAAITIPGARTLIPLEQPGALARALVAFWDGSPERRPVPERGGEASARMLD